MTSYSAYQARMSATLTSEDIAGIQAANDAYRSAWLANDPEAVMRALTEDAVLIPHHGIPPVEGAAAIRNFWWPTGGTPTTIEQFTLTVDEIGGQSGLGYIRGRSAVHFSYLEADEWKTASNKGNFLSLLRQQPDGSWRISHQMWGDPL